MEIGVLGPLCLGDDSRRVGSKKERALLELMAMFAPRATPMVDMVDALWGNDPPASADRTIQSLVSRLRRAVPELAIERSVHGYRLNESSDHIDVCRFEKLIEAARANAAPARSAALLRDALGLWRGTPAPDVAGGAGVWYRVRLEDTRRAAEEELWALRLASGDLRGLSAEIEQAALVEPWRERRWAELMIALYYEGRRAEASRAFHRVRRLFDEELGLVPGPQLLALDRAIVRDEDDTIRQVVRELSAWNDAAGSQPSEAISVAAVPDWLTRFFGRGAERSFVIDALVRSRLVTITGPGGVGKTRLASEISKEIAQRYIDGLWFVDLAGTYDEASVLAAVTTSMGVPPMPGLTLRETAIAGCEGSRALLVLDNSEHVMDHVVSLALIMLSEAPDLRVLATSRAPLGLDGEVILPLQPLTVPAIEEQNLDALLANESIALFLDRATAVAPHFQMDHANAAALVALARRLDGLPLALELGAAQLDVFSPAQLDAMLAEHLELPANSRLSHGGRHGSIDTTVDWSYKLLSEAERAVLDRMSVFRGAANLDATRAVVVDGELVTAHEVATHLASLVRRSLVVAVGGGTDRRYRLLETTREAGWRRLQSAGTLDRYRGRHLDWALSRASEAAIGLNGPRRAEWMQELDLDFDNLESVLLWSEQNPGTAGRALEVVTRLFPYWVAQRNRRECGLRSATNLAQAATDMEPADRAEALMQAAGMALVDDLAAAQQLAVAARRCAEGAPPDSRVARIASLTSSFPEWVRGNPSKARALAAPAGALDGFVGLVARWVSASCLALEGDLGSAYRLIRDVAEAMLRFGDEHFYGYHLARSADFGHALGVPANELLPSARKALDIARVQCPSCEGEALSTLALVDNCVDLGGPPRAARLGLARADELGEVLTVISDLGLLVGVHSLTGSYEHAAWLHGATTTLRTRTGFVETAPGRLAHHRLGVTIAQQALGAERFAQLSDDAADVSYSEIIETALTGNGAEPV